MASFSDPIMRLYALTGAGMDDDYFKPQMLRRTAELRHHGVMRYSVHQDGKLCPMFARLREANVTKAPHKVFFSSNKP